MNTSILSPAISDTPIAVLPLSVESRSSTLRVRTPPIDTSIWASILRVFLFGKVSPRWAIIQPLPLGVELEDDGSYVVGDDIFLVYGNGATQAEAIDDYVISLEELYRLTENGARTDTFDQKQLAALQSYIQPL